jgi:hypothetical protein
MRFARVASLWCGNSGWFDGFADAGRVRCACKDQKLILKKSCQGGLRSQNFVSSCEQGRNKF